MQSLVPIPVLAIAGPRRDLHQFALRVVTQIARTNGIQSGQPNPDLLDLVLRIARTGDPAVLVRLQTEMKRRRISAEHVIDIYFPAAITVIGNDWHESRIDILDATIATARLQSMLREFGRACLADRAENSLGGLVLLAVPPGEQHSLGPMLAAHQLRRLGVSVKIALLPSLGAIEPLLTGKGYDAVFISASNESTMPACRLLTREIRSKLSKPTPIVLGGGLVSRSKCDNDTRRLVAATGVDLATCDLTVALQSCGMNRVSVAAE